MTPTLHWECLRCGLPLNNTDMLPGGACPDCGDERVTGSFGDEDD